MLDFEAHVKDIKSDLNEIKRDVKQIAESTVENTVSLKHHMARTEANEHRIKSVENWTLGLLTSLLLSVFYYFLRR